MQINRVDQHVHCHDFKKQIKIDRIIVHIHRALKNKQEE